MSYMQNRMDDLIQSGIHERDACYMEIDRLTKQNKEMFEALKITKAELNVIGNVSNETFNSLVSLINQIENGQS